MIDDNTDVLSTSSSGLGEESSTEPLDEGVSYLERRKADIKSFSDSWFLAKSSFFSRKHLPFLRSVSYDSDLDMPKISFGLKNSISSPEESKDLVLQLLNDLGDEIASIFGFKETFAMEMELS